MRISFNGLLIFIVMSTFIVSCVQKKGLPNNNNTDSNLTDIKSYVEGKTPTDLVGNSYYRIIEFPATPSGDDQAVLKSPGIQILEYIPDNSYLVMIATNFQKELLLTTAAQTIKKVPVELKTNNQLKSWNIPPHAQVGTKARVSVITMKGLRAKDFEADFKDMGLTVDVYGGDPKFAYLTLTEADVKKVVELPWVRYVEIIDEEGDPESDGRK